MADRLLGVNGRVADPARCSRPTTRRALLRGLRRPARPAPARPGSARSTPGAALARRAAGARGHDRRRDRARRAPAPGRDERHGAQHHHQHAADLRRRLGGALRERQPGRRRAARRQRLRAHGFRDAQSLPHRDRGARPRHRRSRSSRSRAARSQAAAAAPGTRDGDRRRARSRLPPDRRRPPRLRAAARLPRRRSGACRRRCHAPRGIARLRRQRSP